MVKPPTQFQQLTERYAAVGEAYEQFGKAITQAGPLDEKSVHLIKLGISIGMRHEGAVHAHTRKALAGGWTADELRHAAVLAATTMGWPNMMAAYMWVEDELAQRGDGRTVTTEGMS
jgi:4-carboxymuconolactone decarboxylase